MGLLDINMTTPEGEGFNSALMAAAQSLLTPRSQGGGMGAAFGAIPQAMDRAKAQAMKESMFGLEKRKLDTDFAYGAEDRAEAQRKRAELQAMIAALPPDQKVLAILNPAKYVESMMPKEHVVPQGAQLVRGSKVLAQTPGKPDAPPEIVRLMQQRDALPEGSPWRAVIDKAISKATTHAPAATAISYGSPVPVQLADGSIGYAQPGNRPGAPPQMMTDPSGKPLTKPPANLPEQQQKQIIGVQNLQSAIQEYRDQLASFGPLDWAKPDARARMGVKYNNMMLQAKEAYNLGVLNGPDFQILTSVVTDPRSLTGIVTSKEALDQQASELSRIMAGIGQTAATVRTRGQPYSAKPAEGKSPAVPKISGDAEFDALPSGAEFIAPDGSRRRKP